LTSLDENLYSNYQILYTNFTSYVENIETEAFKQSVKFKFIYLTFSKILFNLKFLRLNGFSKSKESTFITFDQAIEKVFDRINLEQNLEQLIKNVVTLEKSRSSLNHETLTSEEKIYYSLANLSSEKKFRTPELLFLEHTYCLIKFAKLNAVVGTYKDLFITYLEKLSTLIKTSTNRTVINSGSIFMCLFKGDWNGVLDNFKNLSTESKWNVLKNLVYFSFKLALFQLVDLKERGSKTSLVMVLNSIYQFTKSMNQIY